MENTPRRRLIHVCRAAGLVTLVVASGARANAVQEPQSPADSVGTVHFPISCSNRAQVSFDGAMALLHHMTYPQARAAFGKVAKLEPRCAMAHWGVAMTRFQPLWPTRPGPDDIRAGREETRRARALGPRTERERLFLDAGDAFFREPDSADYWERIRRPISTPGLASGSLSSGATCEPRRQRWSMRRGTGAGWSGTSFPTRSSTWSTPVSRSARTTVRSPSCGG